MGAVFDIISAYEKDHHHRSGQGRRRHPSEDVHIPREEQRQHPRHQPDRHRRILQHDDDRRCR